MSWFVAGWNSPENTKADDCRAKETGNEGTAPPLTQESQVGEAQKAQA